MTQGQLKPTAKEHADVAIVGGGIMGSAAALALAQAGLNVILLEARLCGSQASGVNFGGVRRQGRHVSQLPLSQRSHIIWHELEKRIGHHCEFETTGHLRLARTDADLDALATYQREAENFDLKLQLLDRQALQHYYPWLSPTLAGASLSPGDGQANPRLVAPWYATKAREIGVRIFDNTPVRQVRYDGRFFQITCDHLHIESQYLLNTAGAWGAEIAHQLGDHVPLKTNYPNMFVTEPIPSFMGPCLGIVRGGFYARQVQRGNVVIGGRHATDNAGLNPARPSACVSVDTLRLAASCIPALQRTAIIRSWTGIEGYIPDHLPVLGPSLSIPGAWHAFGFSGHGFQLGPAVGEVLAELVINGETTTPIGPFSLARFDNSTN